jgi:predicted metal-dependent phosphotriesterase family hydrolase
MCLINQNSLFVMKLYPCIKAQFVFQLRCHGVEQDQLVCIIIPNPHIYRENSDIIKKN